MKIEILKSNGIFSEHISFAKIKKLPLEEIKTIIELCFDVDGIYYNESNVTKCYTTFYPLLTGKFSGKKQDIYTMGLKKYHIEVDGLMEVNGIKLPKWLILYPKNKSDKMIEINLEELNNRLF